MRFGFKAFVGLAAVVAAFGPAEARRTEIDGTGMLRLQGYCDLDGSDCTPVSLGYSVDFGSGPLNSILIYGNGLLTFGDMVADTTRFSGSLADYGVPVIALALNDATTQDFFGSNPNDPPFVFFQDAKLTLGADNSINAVWEICRGSQPSGCSSTYELTLTRAAQGFQATGIYYGRPAGTLIAGYSIPGVTTNEQGAQRTSFLIPATFGSVTSAVPEPATWATMVLGLGIVGGALRRRKAWPVRQAA